MSKGKKSYWSTLEDLYGETLKESESFSLRPAFSVDSPPGKIDNRVFIGGSYVLMPILREIEEIIRGYAFQPILAFDFYIPREKTREYSIRLLHQCELAIFEVTLSNGHLVELARATGFPETKIFQVYMAMDERKDIPKTMSTMVWQSKPPPTGYLTIKELRELVVFFLSHHRK